MIMDIKKLAPWNWFKKEDEASGSVIPVKQNDLRHAGADSHVMHPLVHLHREMDRLFENAVRGFGISHLRPDFSWPITASGLLKPHVDIGATDKEYAITIEVPGVNEKDVKVEISNDTLIIRGEKKQEKEEKNQDYYRVERSYGSFQRLMNLPDDADQTGIAATFKDGVLTVKMPRKTSPKSDVKQIEIKSA